MRLLAISTVLLFTLSGCAAAQQENDPQATMQSSTQAEAESTAEASEESAAEATEEASTEQTEEPTEDDQGEEAAEAAQPTAAATQAPTSTATATQTPSPTATATATPSPTATQEPVAVGYTMADVRSRNTAADCWVAIDGGVYDLTQWIRSHPGGSAAITQLCGTDGTAQFLGQHGGQARPSTTLDGYYIGPLQ